jgi:hypothetical protein
MTNTRYTLAGGMDTPSIAAERQYERMDFEPLEGRFGRSRLAEHKIQSHPDENGVFSNPTIIGGDRNGFARMPSRTVSLAQKNPSAPSWTSMVLNVVGGVVGGVWALCKTTATFTGFTAGGGTAYPLRRTEDDIFASESMWEDEATAGALGRNWERLPTPIPGEYPGDTPSEDEGDQDGTRRRGSKRLQTDGGGWVVIERGGLRQRSLSRARSPRLSTPVGGSTSSPRHMRSTSASIKRHKASTASRHAHRVSAVSFAGSPAPQQHLGGRASMGVQHRRSPSGGIDEGIKRSPPSVEAKKFKARIKREEKVADERFERMNDRLRDMIRQGKEALGSKVEVVEDDAGDHEMKW